MAHIKHNSFHMNFSTANVFAIGSSVAALAAVRVLHQQVARTKSGSSENEVSQKSGVYCLTRTVFNMEIAYLVYSMIIAKLVFDIIHKASDAFGIAWAVLMLTILIAIVAAWGCYVANSFSTNNWKNPGALLTSTLLIAGSVALAGVGLKHDDETGEDLPGIPKFLLGALP